MEPFGYDADGSRLTCGQCGEPVDSITVPITGRPRPRALATSELIVDVMVVSFRAVLPCGHEYRMDQPQPHRITEARKEA